MKPKGGKNDSSFRQNLFGLVFRIITTTLFLSSPLVSNAFLIEKPLHRNIDDYPSRLLSTLVDDDRLDTNSLRKRFEQKRSVLAPLSFDPLLFTSVAPLLEQRDCELLSEWCRNQVALKGDLTPDALKDDDSEGCRLLQKLQNIVHKDVLGFNDRQENVLPRYLQYNGSSKVSSHCPEASQILPDGLHLDTNNGKHFRHWTVLVYLNSTKISGATTFPLATRMNKNKNKNNEDIPEPGRRALTPAQRAAHKLIHDYDLHHTRLSKNEHAQTWGRIMEDTAASLYSSITNDDVSTGIRLLPQQGHMCIFSGLNPDGTPNPLAFHGGEALIEGESKEVLSFFYEIPMSEFSNKEQFGERVIARERDFLKRHL